MVILEYLQKVENQKESTVGAVSEEGIVEDRSYKNIRRGLCVNVVGGGMEDEGGGKRSLTKRKQV